MKLQIRASTDRFAELPWPDGIPLPPANSQVTMMHDGQPVSFVVDQCEFDLTDREVGRVWVRGHHQVAGSV